MASIFEQTGYTPSLYYYAWHNNPLGQLVVVGMRSMAILDQNQDAIASDRAKHNQDKIQSILSDARAVCTFVKQKYKHAMLRMFVFFLRKNTNTTTTN